MIELLIILVLFLYITNVTIKKGNINRKLSMYLIKKHTELKLQEIGRIYDLDYSAVSQSCKRFEREIKEDRKLVRKVKQIENKLTIQL